MEERQLVEDIGEPLAFLLPVHVKAPDGVVQRLVTHVDLGSQGLFGEVHQRTAQQEVLAEVVFPVHAEHRLAFLAVVGVAFERYAHVGAGVDDTLVEDRHRSATVVDTVVAALGEGDAAGRDHHRSLWHVVGT